MIKAKFNKYTVAVGLSWAIISSEKVKAEFAVMTSNIDDLKPYGFIRKIKEDDNTFSHQAALTKDQKLCGTKSAAAILADLSIDNPDLIFIDKISDDKVWICTLASQKVLPEDGDVVVEVDDAKDRFEKILALFDEVPVINFSPEIQKIIDFSDIAVPDLELSFSDVLEKKEISHKLKEFQKYTIKKTTATNKNIFYLSLGAIVLAWYGYQYFEAKQAEEAAYEPEPVIIIDAPKVDSQEVILQKAKEEEIQWLKSSFNLNNPSSIVRTLLAFDFSLNKDFAGWGVSEIKFDSENPHLVTVMWNNLGNGTPLTFRKYINGPGLIEQQIAFGLNGQNAIAKFNIINSKRNISDVINLISTNNYLHEDYMHDLLGIKDYNWNLIKLKPTIRPIRITGIRNKKISQTRQLHLTEYDFSVSNDGSDSLISFIKLLNNANTFILKSVKFTYTTGFHWELSGVIYEI